MADDMIVMGEEILDEAYKLYGCIDDLGTAFQCTDVLREKLPTAYKGAGTTDIDDFFYQPMMNHLNSLMTFYRAAFDFMTNTYIEINGVDEALANMMCKMAVDQGLIDPNAQQPEDEPTIYYKPSEPETKAKDPGNKTESGTKEDMSLLDEEQLAAIKEFLDEYSGKVAEVAERNGFSMEEAFGILGKNAEEMTDEERQLYEEIRSLFSEGEKDGDI